MLLPWTSDCSDFPSGSLFCTNIVMVLHGNSVATQRRISYTARLVSPGKFMTRHTKRWTEAPFIFSVSHCAPRNREEAVSYRPKIFSYRKSLQDFIKKCLASSTTHTAVSPGGLQLQDRAQGLRPHACGFLIADDTLLPIQNCLQTWASGLVISIQRKHDLVMERSSNPFKLTGL